MFASNYRTEKTTIIFFSSSIHSPWSLTEIMRVHGLWACWFNPKHPHLKHCSRLAQRQPTSQLEWTLQTSGSQPQSLTVTNISAQALVMISQCLHLGKCLVHLLLLTLQRCPQPPAKKKIIKLSSTQNCHISGGYGFSKLLMVLWVAYKLLTRKKIWILFIYLCFSSL